MYRGMRVTTIFRTVLCIALFCSVAAVIPTQHANRALAADFLAGFADLPLMPGLSAVEEAGLVFDSPSGRIAEAYASGETDRHTVTEFYRKTLPALGWVSKAENRFEREGEELIIDFFEGGSGITVRFTTAPAQGG